ncbi:thiamine phosphate synthase [Clostridium sp. MSJ-8]|uniref:thiamine phosphate synthase n=1 Tax=Clostridium sp. MSJ-8 TaxID=2841510 RepID=UPI001C0EC63A|nr:thiamine phosphate synthase [Clostridium sp. MSJ-8]MBU5488176.1 thiamine phosphate synthase [Clostridium sp. MSJ-8]
MRLDKKSLLLYAITDRTWLGEETLYSQVKKALEGGATIIQLREKNLDYDSFLKEAIDIKELCYEYGVKFIVNDNIKVAIECDADGVHVGQDDMDVTEVRKLIGKDKIIGLSAQTVEQAKLAQEQGADYLGVGAVFTTSTKKDAKNVTFEELKEICDSVDIPVVAIGGISKDNAIELKGTGIDGISVISAIFAQKDIKKAAEELKRISQEIVK